MRASFFKEGGGSAKRRKGRSQKEGIGSPVPPNPKPVKATGFNVVLGTFTAGRLEFVHTKSVSDLTWRFLKASLFRV